VVLGVAWNDEVIWRCREMSWIRVLVNCSFASFHVDIVNEYTPLW